MYVLLELGVKFQLTVYTGEESDMFVTICVGVCSGSLERDVFVILQTVEDGNAEAGAFCNLKVITSFLKYLYECFLIKCACVATYNYVCMYIMYTGADFVPLVDGQVLFTSGSSVASGSFECQNISIIDDDCVEEEESFSVEIEPGADQPVLIDGASSVPVVIPQDPADSK